MTVIEQITHLSPGLQDYTSFPTTDEALLAGSMNLQVLLHLTS